MNDILNELNEEFGIASISEFTLKLGTKLWTISYMPSYLYSIYGDLLREYPDNICYISCCIKAIDKKPIESIFEVTVKNKEKARREACKKLAGFLSRLKPELLQKLFNGINNTLDIKETAGGSLNEFFDKLLLNHEIEAKVYLVSKLGWSLEDTDKCSSMMLNLLVYYNKKLEIEQINTNNELLGKHLGTLWKSEDFISKKGYEGEVGDTALVPLSLLLEPKIMEIVRKNIKMPTKATPLRTGVSPSDLGNTKNVVQMASLPKEEFLDMLRSAGVFKGNSDNAKIEIDKKE